MGIVIRDALAILPKDLEADAGRIGTHTIYIEKDRIAGIDRRPEQFTEDTVIDGSDQIGRAHV